MSDLISRQDAIKAIVNVDMQVYEGDAAVGRRLYLTQEEMIAIIEALPSAEPERKWIPCSERLPEEEKQHYWVCTDTGYQCQCRWTNDVYGFGASDRWNWKIFDIPQYQKVVAWMPLPESYKGE